MSEGPSTLRQLCEINPQLAVCTAASKEPKKKSCSPSQFVMKHVLSAKLLFLLLLLECIRIDTYELPIHGPIA